MKKAIWTLPLAALVVLMWYLFIRPFEFQVNFSAKTLPGDIIQTIRIWDRSLNNSEIVEVDSLYRLTQNLVWENRSYIYNWNFNTVNDSTTDVNVTITQPARSILNKLLVPFTDQYIEQDGRAIVRKLYEILKMHLKITNVKVLGESEIGPAFCVCRSLETNQIEKANGMMKEFGLLTSFISDFNLEADGPPIIKIREWNHSLGKLKYDFCFPIVKSGSLPMNNTITYKELKKERVVQAVYNGNYITSDRAWYALIRFAESNGYEIDGLPIEYFYNNPTLGVNEIEWRAEVYLPVK
jgi:hypothetical protein